MNHVVRDEKQIGNLIRRIRKTMGLSQTELGKKCGLRQGIVSLIESGNPAVRIRTLLKILSVLELEVMIGPRDKGLGIEELF